MDLLQIFISQYNFSLLAFLVCGNLYLVLATNLFFLKTFNLSFGNGVSTRGLNKILERKQVYLEQERKQGTFPVISNIDEYLPQFLPHSKCLIFIDNHRRTNIAELNSPIFLRNVIPMVRVIYKTPSKKNPKGSVSLYMVFGAKTSSLNNASISGSTASVTCPLSKYLQLFTNKEACSELIMKSFLVHIKPFTCRVQLGLFPPENLENSDYQSLYTMVHKSSSHFTLSTSAPVMYSVALMEENRLSRFDRLNTQLHWIDSARAKAHTSHFSDVFVIYRVKRKLCKFQGVLDAVGIITSFDVLKACPDCLQEDGISLGTIRKTTFYNFTLTPKILVSHGCTQPEEKLILQVLDYRKATNLLAMMLQNLYSCKKKSFEKEFWVNIFKGNSSLVKAGMAHAEVFKSVMKNFSVVGTRFKSRCTVSKLSDISIEIEQQAYDMTSHIFPYYSKDHLSRLRFIGCGRQGLTSLAFNEFIKVFDNSIWFCLLAVLIAAPLAMRQVRMQVSIGSGTISILKVLLEQGNPFSTSVANSKRLRFLLAMSLLAGIVLSNAYKNTNVYNMVVPRQPILYKYFHELIRDKFEIYTRSISSHFLAFKPNDDGYESLDNLRIHNYSVVIAVETKYLLDVYNKSILENLKLGGYKQHKNLEGLVRSMSRMHPNSKSTFFKLLLDKISHKNQDWRKDVLMAVQIFPEFQTLETELLLGSLQNCEKTAVIVPYYATMEFETELVKRSHMTNAFIGEESYSDTNWLFTLDGLVPPHVIKRIIYISESGICQWWMDLFDFRRHVVKQNDLVQPASMSGNIIVVFILLVSGFAVAGACYICENYHVVMKRFGPFYDNQALCGKYRVKDLVKT